MASRSILEPGRNCGRIARAGRAAFLVDAADYFDALADAIERAERQVLLVGWDFHSRVALRRGDAAADPEAQRLVPLLEAAVRRQRRLHIHVLCWDFAVVFAFEREPRPVLRFQERTHRRIEFCLDGEHPVAASHHQKIAVIDDALAFCGGIDVTLARWDTREHRAGDPRRRNPDGEPYGPFHDAQMLVDGAAAVALGEIARDRWRRATGRRLRAPGARREDVWPASVPPSLRDVDVAIARTDATQDGAEPVREVEALFLDAIAAARRSLYVENQYLTSHVVGGALAERLREDDGPEVVLVLPSRLSGWLEEHSMGVLMSRLLERLRRADRHDRLRVYTPVLPGDDPPLMVHAKLLVVDDRLVRVGSANLSNRSMGLDTECDLAVESTSERDVREQIAGFRDDLLAEHLGVSREDVAAALRAHGSLIAAIESLRGGARTLAPLSLEVGSVVDALVPGNELLDPEAPFAFERMAEFVQPEDEEQAGGGPGFAPLRLLASAVVIVALLALWHATPLSAVATSQSVAPLAQTLQHGASGLLLGFVLFTVAAVLLVPVVPLLVGVAFLFEFWKGWLVAFAGSLAAAAIGYGLGQVVWRDALHRIGGGAVRRVSLQLSQRGVLATVAVRVIPVAPFAIVNLVAGASHVRLRDFLLGTAIGMAPGTAAIVYFGERASRSLSEPSPSTIGTALAVLAALVLASEGLRRLVRRRSRRRRPTPASR